MNPRIYYLNKHWDAAGFGHAAVMIPNPSEHAHGYTYYSFFASRKFLPLCPGTLLVKEFPSAKEALAYAKTEGYTREVHWPIDPANIKDARNAITQNFATGTPWNLLSRSCWSAVHAALIAAGIQLKRHTFRPNRNFDISKNAAEGWSAL
jgi:hypothetical protein